MISAADVRALVVTPDAGLASIFAGISSELGIVTHTADLHQGLTAELEREKYEAMLIDFDSIDNARVAVAALRANPSSRGAVIFAVATESQGQQAALNNGANFVFGRPLDSKELRRTVYAAYDAMTQERRRYFRCTAELPVFFTRADGSDLVARTANISANGMSIGSSTSFTPGERIGITLELQSGGPHVLARGVVVWDDKHGKTGISFHCVRPELQNVLDSWLNAQFNKLREDSVRELHKVDTATQSRD